MKAVIRLGTAIGLATMLCAISMAQHPGRNAFLLDSARSTRDLISQVSSNAEVRDSYQRHFQMSQSQLITYLRTLRPMRLERDQVFTIYSVPPGGELKAHQQRLRKGELVFVDMNGTPILRARCGNPLVGAPPGVVPEEEVAFTPPTMHSMEVPMAEAVPGIPLAVQPAPPMVPELVAVTPQPPVEVVTHSQSLPLLPLLALPIIGSSHGGGSSPVPEPATMVALAAGVGTLMARRRRSR